ncbi:hypothetical protein ABT143_29595, partial [Streptomyces sp. NPDC002033]
MTEYPTSQEGPQPAVAPGGGTDEPGHGKAPIAAAEAVRTHAQTPAADLPRPRAAAAGGPQGARSSGHGAADTGPAGARTRAGSTWPPWTRPAPSRNSSTSTAPRRRSPSGSA